MKMVCALLMVSCVSLISGSAAFAGDPALEKAYQDALAQIQKAVRELAKVRQYD